MMSDLDRISAIQESNLEAVQRPLNETERLSSLRAHAIMDTAADPYLDVLTCITADKLSVPIVMVNLLASGRQWAKAAFGLPRGHEVPRDLAFCSYTILTPGELTVVPDATLDTRFANNPLVVGEPHIRFYAGVPIVDVEGRALGALCAIDTAPRDFTAADGTILTEMAKSVSARLDLYHSNAALRESQENHLDADQRLANIINNVPGYIFQRIMEPDGTITYPYFSPSIFRILDLPENTDWSTGQSAQYLHPDDRDHFLRAVVQSGTDITRILSEFRFVSPAGKEFWFRTDSMPRALPNGSVVWDGLAVDISVEKSSELQLSYLAQYDSLTGLANRLSFGDNLLEAILASKVEQTSSVLIYADLDDFEGINRTRGQRFGDRVLRRVGLILKDFAEARGGLAARLGGDEFAISIPAVSLSKSHGLAEAICGELSRLVLIDGQEAVIEACVGAATFVKSRGPGRISAADSCAELMNQARLSLQAAKRKGPGSYQYYSPQLDDEMHQKVATRQSLQRALKEEQFELHYQPLVALESGKIIGAEALIRWNHPEHGMQRPDLFIPVAESNGLIVPLGEWVLKQAMKQAQEWKQQGIPTPRIAINVSSIQLQKPGFVAAVEQALAETGANACDFELELTEGILIDSSSNSHNQLTALKSLGFELVIDDFGTGHSTFKYLRQLSVDKIKIDQSFVRQLVVDSNDASIIRAMIALSRSLKLKVVAEGIETVMQRDFLRDEGCKIGQGYFFSPPMAGEDFAWMLKQRLTLPVGNISQRSDEPGNGHAEHKSEDR